MFRFIFSVLAGFFALSAKAADLPPDQLVKTTAQEVLTLLKTDKDIQTGNVKKAYELVEAKILPHFDFNRMTQLAVGKYWNSASPKQKQALVKEFRSLLVRTYAASLTEFSNQTVDFKPLNMRPDDMQVTVKTEIKQPGGKSIPIDYEMYKTDFGWKVFDVAIDGVSLVINYRSSFANTIRKSGIDGLIATLEAKSRRLDKQAAPVKPSGNTRPSASSSGGILPTASIGQFMIEQKRNVCWLSGDVTLDTVAPILEKLRPLIQSGKIDTLNFSSIKNVDSSALALIFSCRREAWQKNQSLKISGLPARLLELASLYGVADLVA